MGSHPSDGGGKARHDEIVGLVETMLNPSAGLRAWLHKDLPKAKTPHTRANGIRLTAHSRARSGLRTFWTD
jgi:hypothetical protein